MLFYGDARARVPTEDALARVRESRALVAQKGGRARREALVRLLLDAGELTQGLLDADLRRRHTDAPTPLRATLTQLGAEIAAAFVAALHGPVAPPELPALDELVRMRAPSTIRVTAPAGFTLHAVYPELYARASEALRARGETSSVSVIGVRSIGASLAPVVAAAAGPPARTTLVRPGGQPHARTLAIADALGREILSDRQALFAVVGDGPGMSGSSFGCVGDWLEAHGVPTRRVWYFPSHAAPLGPRASERHRARWATAKRVVVEPNEEFFRGVIGELDGALVDVSGGRWRRHAFATDAEWPPVDATLERRKFLVGQGDDRRIFKFAGLGRYADERRARAERLAERGLIPRVRSVRHGFLEEPWLEGVRASALPAASLPRVALVDAVATYLAELAASFPAPRGREGANARHLLAMAKHNTAEALGPAYARELDRWADQIGAIARAARYVLTDNRMHAWEWLVTGGRVIKCDAHDHHAGHDLVGPQDIAWDVAGAKIELGLDDDELARVVHAVTRRAGTRGALAHLAFYVDAYLAFQLGAWTVAQEQTRDDVELVRLRAATRFYSDSLRRRIET